MLIYWLLLGYAGLLSLVFPQVFTRHGIAAGHVIALAVLATFYTMLALVRHEIGADWHAYEEMYQIARVSGASEAFSITDPLFSLLIWLSAQIGAGVYLPNAICAALLVAGVISVAMNTRDPWLGICSAIPYILIVIGFGYVRQGGAIGLVALAIAAMRDGRTVKTICLLGCAAGFHSTAAGIFPFFAFGLAKGSPLKLFVPLALGSAVMVFLVSQKLETFEMTYIASDFQSSGAVVRILMNVIASAVIILARNRLVFAERTRALWLLFSFANLISLLLLLAFETSTAVDRIALYFSLVQVFFFGNIRDIVPITERSAPVLRLLVIGVAIMVQLIWLVYATHADAWVPYKTVLTYA